MSTHSTVLFLATLSLALLLVAGCTLDQRLELSADGRGSGAATVTIDPAVIAYIDALSGAFADDDEPVSTPLFDLPTIRSAFSRREGIELLGLRVPARDTLEIEFSVSDIEQAAGEVIEFATDGSGSNLVATIDRSSFLSLSSFFLAPDSPIAVFIPTVESDFLDRTDYRELASYVFTDYLIDRTLDEFLESASMRVSVISDGAVSAVEAEGARITEVSDAGFELELSVVDLVTLESPIIIETAWR